MERSLYKTDVSLQGNEGVARKYDITISCGYVFPTTMYGGGLDKKKKRKGSVGEYYRIFCMNDKHAGINKFIHSWHTIVFLNVV